MTTTPLAAPLVVQLVQPCLAVVERHAPATLPYPGSRQFRAAVHAALASSLPFPVQLSRRELAQAVAWLRAHGQYPTPGQVPA